MVDLGSHLERATRKIISLKLAGIYRLTVVVPEVRLTLGRGYRVSRSGRSGG